MRVKILRASGPGTFCESWKSSWNSNCIRSPRLSVLSLAKLLFRISQSSKVTFISLTVFSLSLSSLVRFPFPCQTLEVSVFPGPIYRLFLHVSSVSILSSRPVYFNKPITPKRMSIVYLALKSRLSFPSVCSSFPVVCLIGISVSSNSTVCHLHIFAHSAKGTKQLISKVPNFGILFVIFLPHSAFDPSITF